MTTLAPTTPAPTTLGPVLGMIIAKAVFRRGLRQMVARATIADSDHELTREALDVSQCTAELFSESASLGSVAGEVDLAGDHYVRFLIPNVDRAADESYVLSVSLRRADTSLVGTRLFSLV